MTSPTSDADDPIADQRGKQGTNYPHGVGDHPATRTPDAEKPDNPAAPGAWDDDLK